MTTANQVLDIERAQLGQAEDPPGSNHNAYTTWYGMRGAWCAMFQSWCLSRAGLGEIHFAWCNAGAQGFQTGRWGTWHAPTETPRPGDLVFWSDGSPNLAHVSMVETANSPDDFVTIDGNWGDKVQRVTRAQHSDYTVAGFGRPHYAADPAPPGHIRHTPGVPPGKPLLRRGSKGAAVRQLQIALDYCSRVGLATDGDYGPMTEGAVAAMQRFSKIDVDGVYGPKSAEKLAAWVALK